MQIDQIDHFVLTVQDIERSVAFYTDVLGMEVVTYGERTALHFGQQKINLHPVDGPIDLKAEAPTTGAADFCLLTDDPLTEVIAALNTAQVTIESGPVPRIGAAGTIVSVYFRDPDGNLIEVANMLDDSYTRPAEA